MLKKDALPNGVERGVITTVHQGDCHVSDAADVTFSTVLGSCIAACVRDTAANVGGMNHFLLAEQSGSAKDRYGASARYGAYAMEELINKVLKKGTGHKGNLEVKVFGGGKINSSLADVGAKNIDFVHKFLSDEGFRISSEDMGGTFARRVLFSPTTGRVRIKRLDSATGQSVVREEMAIAGKQEVAKPQDDDIELF